MRPSTGPVRPWAALVALAYLLIGPSCHAGTRAPGGHEMVVVAVGDIACGQDPTPGDIQRRCRYDRVGNLVRALAPDRFLAVGGVQYPLGGPPDFAAHYDRYFGTLKAITSPTPGDADWVPDADAYFEYFGEAAGPPGGYYSFDLGSWHVISLNSQDCFDVDGCDPRSEQFEWLRADLASHPNDLFPCTLAFFHDPRFLWVEWWERNGEPRGPETRVTSLWSLLYGSGVDVAVNAGAHNYERWAPQDVGGRLDRRHGITEFVVGTGGKRLIPFGPEPRPRLLTAGTDAVYGVLRLELGTASLSYSWRSAPQQPTFHDDGAVTCH